MVVVVVVIWVLVVIIAVVLVVEVAVILAVVVAAAAAVVVRVVAVVVTAVVLNLFLNCSFQHGGWDNKRNCFNSSCIHSRSLDSGLTDREVQ